MKTIAPRHFLAALAVLSILSSSFLYAADPATLTDRCVRLLGSGPANSTTSPNVSDAIIALGMLGDENAITILSARYKEENNHNLRLSIVRSIGLAQRPSALASLEAAATDPYHLVPKAAARAIESINGKKPPQGFFRSAIFAPEKCNAETIFERCRLLITYGSPRGASATPTKHDAIIALGLLGDERAVPLLCDHLVNEENQSLRSEIVRALGWLNSPAAIPSLQIALHDPYLFVRKYSAEVLQQLTGRKYAYDKTGEAEGRERVQDMIEIQRTSRRLDDLDLDRP